MKITEMTEYAKAWKEFTESDDYARCIKNLYQKGVINPYAANILRTAFDAGWNNKPSK
jgi:uncharacterized protein YutE (UPF0331/DUF86 family)